MPRESFDDLLAFIAVARERSFTRAAAKLGVTQSALSHSIRELEEKLGLRLLTRTTRSVSPTEAGERLLQTAAPRIEEIKAELQALRELHEKPVGTFRISAAEHSVDSILWPKLAKFLLDYPGIKIEININYGMVDIVAERYDAGVRLGNDVAKDMIAVRIAPDLRMVIVGASSYFENHPIPLTPQDLALHNCIALRLPTHDSLYAWELIKEGHEIKVAAQGQWVFNSGSQILKAALAGFGLAYLPEDMVQEQVNVGRLKQVLEDWSPTFPGYHLYYPSRRQASKGFTLLVNALRYSY
ncbi:MAG: LysR family transcriptional regulator [Thiotrichaceae bacterium]|nr:LysR family transcriptional regulator [Thiotrichaceae bacterium]